MLTELISTPIGLLSLFTLGFVVVMGLYIWYRLAKASSGKE